MSAEPLLPITAASVAGAALGWALGLDGPALVGSFTGAAIFVGVSSEFSIAARIGLLFASWAFGYNTPQLLQGWINSPFIAAFAGGLLCVALSCTLLEGVKTGKLPAWLRFIRSGGSK